MPLFELGSLHHDYYLINIKIPVDELKGINFGLGHLKDVWLVVRIKHITIIFNLLGITNKNFNFDF